MFFFRQKIFHRPRNFFQTATSNLTNLKTGVDPVMVSTSGARLPGTAAVKILTKNFLPLDRRSSRPRAEAEILFRAKNFSGIEARRCALEFFYALLAVR